MIPLAVPDNFPLYPLLARPVMGGCVSGQTRVDIFFGAFVTTSLVPGGNRTRELGLRPGHYRREQELYAPEKEGK